MARELSQGSKFVARTAPELFEAVDQYVRRLAVRGTIKFRDRRLSNEAAVNAVLLDFMDKPESERTALLVRNVRRFEHILASDTPVAIGPDSPSPHVNATNVYDTKGKVQRKKGTGAG